ncbi:unnamed protein product [Protopolystoma xenopodis]|uniref:Uncharacterized protein n=1 Tax=Protopolystoma xenopodis TaxID=117903 RepID=A0A448WTQ8_9PLAT|nr:unnamed protein product [Protopolystoma xenopodis]
MGPRVFGTEWEDEGGLAAGPVVSISCGIYACLYAHGTRAQTVGRIAWPHASCLSSSLHAVQGRRTEEEPKKSDSQVTKSRLPSQAAEPRDAFKPAE